MALLEARKAAFVRLSLLLTLVALALSLVVSAWSNRREAVQVSESLDRAEADRFFRAVAEVHQKQRRAATSEELRDVLERYREDGLRYVAVFRDGALLAEAGERTGPEGFGRGAGPGTTTRVGSRLRSVVSGPPGPPGPSGPPGPPPSGAPDRDVPDGLHPPQPGPGAERPSRPRFPDVVLEFEPAVSERLRGHATRGFVFASTAAAVLLGLALALGALLLREERRRERRERERNLTTLGEMSAVLAHEIRNPLASLKGHAQLLTEQLADDSPHRRKVTRIVEEAKRLEGLTSTLLDFVRSARVDRTDTKLLPLFQDAAAGFPDARIQLDLGNAPESWSLDALRIGQVLRNLFENAAEASPADTPIEAHVRTERGELVISVRDHGRGIPSGDEQRIFDAFHTTRTHGTGLGLAVARRIAELHGGSLTAQNHPSGGAEFVLRILG